MIKETSLIYSQRDIDRANDLMKNIIPSSPSNFYESTYDATSSNNIQNTLQTLLTRLKNERTVTSSNGKVLIDNIDATKGIKCLRVKSSFSNSYNIKPNETSFVSVADTNNIFFPSILPYLNFDFSEILILCFFNGLYIKSKIIYNINNEPRTE